MIKDYWVNATENFSKNTEKQFNSHEAIKWADFILNEIKELEEPIEILDIGTGAGFFPLILSSETRHVIGIDLTETMIEEASNKIKKYKVNSDVLVMDAQDTSFKDNSFDIIICRNLVWTLPDPIKAYKEWNRILKKDGLLLIFDGSWYIHHYDEEHKKIFNKKRKEMENLGVEVYLYGDKETRPDDYNLMLETYLKDKYRPEWDVKNLTELGFDIEKVLEEYMDVMFEKDYRAKQGMIAPLFFIKAKKIKAL